MECNFIDLRASFLIKIVQCNDKTLLNRSSLWQSRKIIRVLSPSGGFVVRTECNQSMKHKRNGNTGCKVVKTKHRDIVRDCTVSSMHDLERV